MRKVLFYGVLGSLAWSTTAQPTTGVSLRRREVENPSTTDFIRRSFAAATVIGDFVYIDGGEVSQLVNGAQPLKNQPSQPVNSTLSISLKQSWTNSTVPIGAIAKDAPVLNSQAIWTDTSSNSFYIWGGQTALQAQPPDDQIWQFFADGNGGGSWSSKLPANPKVFNQLVRPEGCAFTQNGNDVGYCMGGLVTSQSNDSVTADTAIPGLVSMGMKSTVWTNTSTSGFGPSGTLVNGAAEFVPFGPNGLMMFLGGAEAPAAGVFDASSAVDRDFTDITFLDPITQQWFSQGTTGTLPSGRQRFCAVGVQGPSNTYEIFLYGGVTDKDTATSDEVFVLSLPGFVFSKASGPGTPRADHACVVVGPGRRQMLSVGGSEASLGYPTSLSRPDPWAQGLGVFDMTAMQWTTQYDVDAAAYDTPDVVKQFYTSGGLSKVVWSSDAVKKIFTSTTPKFTSGTGTGGSTTSSSTSSPNNTNTNDTQRSTAIPLAAVIGLATGGGVVVLGTTAGFLFYLLRRRRRQYLSSSSSPPNPPTTETSPVPPPARQHPYSQLRDDNPAHPPRNRSEEDWGKSGAAAYSVFIKGNATPLPLSSSAVPLGSNPVTLRSDLASRRGVRTPRAIRTGSGDGHGRGIRVYQATMAAAAAGSEEEEVARAR